MSYKITKGISSVCGAEDFELTGLDNRNCSHKISVEFNDRDEIENVRISKINKTPEEELRDDIFRTSGLRARDGGHEVACNVAYCLLEKYNITKKES